MPRLVLVAPTMDTTIDHLANFVKGIDPNAVVAVTAEYDVETCTAIIEQFGGLAEDTPAQDA